MNLTVDQTKELIESKLSTRCIKELGSGCYGRAYLTSENTVVKSTTSEREINLFYMKMNQPDSELKGMEYLCEIYGIWKFGKNQWGNDLYIIEREYFDSVLDDTDEDTDEMWEIKAEIENFITDIHPGNVAYKDGKFRIFDAHTSYNFPILIDHSKIPSLL